MLGSPLLGILFLQSVAESDPEVAIFLVSRYFAFLIHQGTVVLEVPFIVAPEANNPDRVPRSSVLRLTISACMSPFMGFRQLVHVHVESSHITPRVEILTLIRTP